jgi:hypothetical protein
MCNFLTRFLTQKVQLYAVPLHFCQVVLDDLHDQRGDGVPFVFFCVAELSFLFCFTPDGILFGESIQLIRRKYYLPEPGIEFGHENLSSHMADFRARHLKAKKATERKSSHDPSTCSDISLNICQGGEHGNLPLECSYFDVLSLFYHASHHLSNYV